MATKLAVLVREHGDTDAGEPLAFPGGAALLAPDGRRAWILLDADPERSLGAALAWARQRQVADLQLIVDGGPAGVVARRAGYFAPPPLVWRAVGRTLEPAEPTLLVPPIDPDPGALALAPILEAAGVDVVVEHGEIVAEVLGLEIARVVRVDDGFHIEVGVGRHDREAFGLVHSQMPTPGALASVAATVRTHRTPDAPDHPLKRLASERWLRELVIEAPASVGAADLERVAPPWPRRSLNEMAPAVAAGSGAGGDASLVVVCSVGIDLDLIPAAADARAAIDPEAELVLVLPERDAYPVTRDLAARLVHPARLVVVPGDWHQLAG